MASRRFRDLGAEDQLDWTTTNLVMLGSNTSYVLINVTPRRTIIYRAKRLDTIHANVTPNPIQRFHLSLLIGQSPPEGWSACAATGLAPSHNSFH
jgi:hypothetical protein